jgi:DNA-binding response OmpR family regulator
MAASPAPILVVDSDLGVLQRVEAILRRVGHEVAVATDGALAINKALAAPPQLILTATEMPLLDGFKLCQLLRTNPVTREIPFIFLTTKETSTANLGKYLRSTDEFLLKPFKEEELLGRVETVLHRGRGQRAGADEEQRLLGNLTEITLMDLLQVLRMNRRSGLLELESEGRHGTLFLSEGEVVDAEVGKFRGEKAFYRTLEWTAGKFEFRPQQVVLKPRIKRPGENLILEGLRQLDEVVTLRARLAPPGTRLELVKRFEGSPERLKPVTREILKLLQYFSSLDDILNQSAFLDLELCQTLALLVDRSIVAVAAPRPESRAAAQEVPLLTLEESLKLSYQLGVGREEGPRVWSGKVLIIPETAALLRPFLESLSRLREFRIEASVVLGQAGDTVPLGPVGTIQVLEGTELILYSLPGEAAYRPLWASLANGAVGGLVLASRFPPFPPFAHTADAALHLPFVVSGPGIGAADGGAWKPSVPWAVAGYEDGDEATVLAAFKTFFGLILAR